MVASLVATSSELGVVMYLNKPRIEVARNPFIDPNDPDKVFEGWDEAPAYERYRAGCVRVAWASLADGLVGVLSLGYLRSHWAQRATVDLLWRTLKDKRTIRRNSEQFDV